MMSDQTILSENQSYWTGRAAGYSAVNRLELSTAQRQKWSDCLRAEIARQFPDRAPESLRVLDIGTGPGFFAILLTELGYAVTAVDLTRAMLDEAQKNAGALADRIQWMEGNAQALDFADKTFKVVGRSLPDAKDYLPHWEIDLGDGKLIRASADEIIPSAIPTLQRSLYLPDPTPRKLEEAMLLPGEGKSITRREAEGKLSQLLQEFQKSGVKANGIMELLNSAGRKLQAAQGR